MKHVGEAAEAVGKDEIERVRIVVCFSLCLRLSLPLCDSRCVLGGSFTTPYLSLSLSVCVLSSHHIAGRSGV